MDYPGWELERQRAALAALLLGGAAAERAADPQAPARHGPAGDAAAAGGENGAEDAAARNEEAVSGEGRGLSQAAHRAGRNSGRREKTPAPPSAWEELLGAETAAELLERKNWGAGVPGTAGGGGTAQGAVGQFPNRQAAAQKAGPGRSERTGGQAAEEAAPDLRAAEEADGVLYGRGGGETAAGKAAVRKMMGKEAAPVRSSGGEGDAGKNAAAVDPLRAARFRRGGGEAVQAPGQDGLPVFQSLELTGGTVPWGAGRGAGAARTEDGARALSRAVQRDARRYDGGFTIY